MSKSNHKISIAILATSYPLSSDSCSGIFIKRFVNKLPKHVNVELYVPDGDVGVTNKDPSINLIRYGAKRHQTLCHKPGGIPVALSKKSNYLLVPQFLIALFLAVMKAAKKHDLIHANWSICGLVAIIPSKIYKTPLVVTLRGEDMTRANTSKVYFYILKLIVLYANAICVVSEQFKCNIDRLWPEMSKKILVVENGVEDNYLNKKPTLYKRDNIKLVFIGSLIKRKNLLWVLENLKETNSNNYIFNIVGEGEELVELLRYVNQNGLDKHVILSGSASPDMTIKILEDSDVLILPSISEGRPNVVLEAMALGKLVIASNIPGTNELIENNSNGMLFQLNDKKSFSHCIDRVLSGSEELIKYCYSAQSSIKKRGLLWSNTAEKYVTVYEELIVR